VDRNIPFNTEQGRCFFGVLSFGKARMGKARILPLAKGWCYRKVSESTFASFDLIRNGFGIFSKEGIAIVLPERAAELFSVDLGGLPSGWRLCARPGRASRNCTRQRSCSSYRRTLPSICGRWKSTFPATAECTRQR